jgi:hypothetical protein
MLAPELAIRTAMLAVESMPADPALTDAVVLLEQAQARVADFIDAKVKELFGPTADVTVCKYAGYKEMVRKAAGCAEVGYSKEGLRGKIDLLEYLVSIAQQNEPVWRAFFTEMRVNLMRKFDEAK